MRTIAAFALCFLLIITEAATIPKPFLLSPAASRATLSRVSQPGVNATLVLSLLSTYIYPYLRNSDPHAVNEPVNELYFYHIPHSTLNLYIRDVGSRLPLDDISACLQSLGIYIIRQITIHGDGPSIPRTFRHGIVFLGFDPQGMTWIDAAEVADALENIITYNDWTWATHITVGDTSRTEGAVAYLKWGFRAPGTGSASSGDVVQPT